MITTAIINQKGGTGKTVSSINAAAILAHDYGQRVLLVDADSQANLTEFVSKAPSKGKVFGGMTDLLLGREAMPVRTKIDNVWLLPADEKLMALDVTAAGAGTANTKALKPFLQETAEAMMLDRCFIDCPPAFSAASMAALRAADEVVIPVKLDAFGIRGVQNILEQVRNMKRINKGLRVLGVLPTMFYDAPKQRAVLENMRAGLKAREIHCLYPIHRSIMVDDSTFAEEPLIFISPKSKACRCYRRFVMEMLDLEGGEQ